MRRDAGDDRGGATEKHDGRVAEDCLMAGLQSPIEHEELGILRRMRELGRLVKELMNATATVAIMMIWWWPWRWLVGRRGRLRWV